MIVDRSEFKFFFKDLDLNMIFCSKKYYLLSIENVKDFIQKYRKNIQEIGLTPGKNWDCSKFCMHFKNFCDLIYKNIPNGGHLAIGICHIELEEEVYDHAVNLIFYKSKDNKIDFLFYDPQSNEFSKDKNFFKKIRFLYF